MIKKSNKIEVLAPCGGMESLIAAVRNGADAVYLGGINFSARQNAANFSDSELKQAVEYCHLNGVKVYQAVNTLVFDSQIETLLNTVKRSAEIGVDALILQDLGAVNLIRKMLPEMPIHASTQMSIHTPNGVAVAKELGFSRVVAARELTKQALGELVLTDMPIEMFVHGAHCMSVSGQCFMSAMFGGRSANRGNCGQACRLPFSFEGSEKSYMLSLKDMSLVTDIPQLMDMGVKSIKIEGRMKRPEYVAAAVKACGTAVLGEDSDLNTLRAVFSRGGFTDGYFENKVTSDMFGYREKEDVISAEDVLPALKESYHRECKSAKINFTIDVKAGSHVKLIATDEDGNTVTVEGDIPQVAQNRSTDLPQIEKQLSKLGDTIYELNGINGLVQDGLYLSVASINELRRQVIAELNSVRITKNTPKYQLVNIDTTRPSRNNSSSRLIRLELLKTSQILGLDLSDIDQITLPLSEVFPQTEKLNGIKHLISIAPPRFIVNNEKEIVHQLKILKDLGYNNLYCNNLAHVKIGKDLNFVPHGGYGLNITNSYALIELSELGLSDAIVSFEMKLGQIEALSGGFPFGIIAHGQLPLMLVRNCPVRAEIGCGNCSGSDSSVVDRKGKSFRIACEKGVDSWEKAVEILNPDVLYMADRLDEIKGVNFITLKLYTEIGIEINELVDTYKTEQNETPSLFTRGLYYRGVM